MHTIHLLAYKYDGDGLKACEVLSEILFMLAQVGTGRHLRYLLGQCPLDDLSSMPPVATSGYGSGDSDIPAHIDSSGLYTPPVQDWGARLDATQFESLRSNKDRDTQDSSPFLWIRVCMMHAPQCLRSSVGSWKEDLAACKNGCNFPGSQCASCPLAAVECLVWSCVLPC